MSIEKKWLTKAGLWAIVTMNERMGFRCGYVCVDEGHPLYGKDYDSAETKDGEYIDVHGGLTFADANKDFGHGWWFGYDCGHLGDGHSPDYHARMHNMFPHHPIMWSDSPDDVFKDLLYCEMECEKLAEQLKAWEVA